MPWYVEQSAGTGYLSHILEFLMREYTRLFGADVMQKATCIVYNDPSAPCPRFMYTDPLRIRLHQSSLIYWAQTVYQLSHEMCHYAFYQKRALPQGGLSWFEEIVAEAMSFYALHYAATNWRSCELSYMNAGFAGALRDYLKVEMATPATAGLRSCTTVQKLRAYEEGHYPENAREGHAEERCAVFRAILACPENAKHLLNYVDYIDPRNGITLRCDLWYRAAPCELIRTIAALQPVK